MNIQQLIYAVETYRCGSISKAAQKLYQAQPNLSSAIKDLENEIGIQIFHRTKAGVVATEAGEGFLTYASDIVARFEHLQNQYRMGEKSNRILSVITARSSFISLDAADFINDAIKEPGSFRIQLKESTNFSVINEVASGEADIGILRANTHDEQHYLKMAGKKDLKAFKLPPIPYVVLLSRKHPLADRDIITSKMLEPYPEVLHGDYETPMYPFSDIRFHNYFNHAEQKYLIQVTDRGTLMDMLSHVEGCYMWTSSTHPDLMRRFDLVEKQCEAPPVYGVDSILIKRNRYVTPEMQSFIDLISRRREAGRAYAQNARES